MMDELVIEEMSIRAVQEKMDEAFRAAMQRAINAGDEHAATVVSKKPGYSKPEDCIVLIVAATHDPFTKRNGDRRVTTPLFDDTFVT